MKKNGAELLSIFLISMLVFCSVSISAYADEVNEWGYHDSFVNDSSIEDKSLFFIPIVPPSDYSNYMIFYYPSDDCYYAYLSDGFLGGYYIYAGKKIVTESSWDLYRYQPRSNTWEFVLHDGGWNFWNYDYSGMVVIDATLNVQRYGIGEPIINSSNRARTGYRIYWNLAMILINVLGWTDYAADYIMQHELIRYACLTALGGEFLMFCVLLLRRVGDIRNEEVNM